VINPVRSEQEAFRFLLYVFVVVLVVVGGVLLLRLL
jgi:Tfp pilus assembly protein PilN